MLDTHSSYPSNSYLMNKIQTVLLLLLHAASTLPSHSFHHHPTTFNPTSFILAPYVRNKSANPKKLAL